MLNDANIQKAGANEGQVELQVGRQAPDGARSEPEAGQASLGETPVAPGADRTASSEGQPLSKQEKLVVNQLLTSVFDSITRIEEASLNNRLTQDLTIAELHTIAAIGLHESVPMKVIAGRLGVTLATVTVAVNKLKGKGHVERKRCSTDRRQVLVSLTTTGRKAWRAHDAFHRKMTDGALEGLDPDDARVLIRTLGQVKDFFENEEQEFTARRER